MYKLLLIYDKNKQSPLKHLFWRVLLLSIKPFRKFIIFQLLLYVAWAIDFSLRPYLIKIIVDTIPNATISGTTSTFFTPILLYFSLICFVFLTSRLYEWIFLRFSPLLIKHIGEMLITELIDKPHEFFQNQFSGSLANKVGDVANGISGIISTFIENFLSRALALLITIYAVHCINPKLALILILWITIFLSISFKFSNHASLLSKNTAQKRSKIVGHIVDILTNMLSVRVFNTQAQETQTLANMYNKFVRSYQKREWFFMKMHTTQEVSFILYQILCFVWLYQSAKNSTITPGDFAMIMVLNISIVGLLYSVSRNIRQFAESFGNVMQGLETIYGKAEGQVSHKNDKSRNIQCHYNKDIYRKGEISVINLSFSYPTSDQIFNNISITIPATQKIGLVGYSGSGKTTFMNLMLGLFKVNSGQILIEGQDISNMPREILYSKIGVIPQDINLFNRNLMENIRYGRIDATDLDVIEAAQKAKAHKFISNLPEGYLSVVGERGIKLSGGERQRIAIARVILKNAPILFLDEATNQLDAITEHEIQESLDKLMRDKTTIVIAHRLSTILHLDRILVFDKGKIVQDGVHHNLIAQEGLYKTLWKNQSHGFLPTSKVHTLKRELK